MYSQKLLDHFQYPRNAGDIPEGAYRAIVENPACGDVLELAMRTNGAKIVEVRFRAKGCVPSMACASAVTELVAGRSLQEALRITPENVRVAVNGVPAASTHALDLAVDAVRAVLHQIPEASP